MKKNIKNTGKLFFNKNFTLLVITILICNVFIINNTNAGTYPISGKMNNSNLQADFNWRVNLYNSEIRLLKYKEIEESTPLFDDFSESIFVGVTSGYLYKINSKDGKIVWKTNLEAKISSSISMLNDNIYAGCTSGELFAISKIDGKIIWKYEASTEIAGKPVVYGNSLYIVTQADEITALNIKDGKRIWLYNHINSYDITIRGVSSPLIINNLIVTAFSDGYVVALDKEGQIKWKSKPFENARFTDIDTDLKQYGNNIIGGHIYKGLFALNYKTGKLIWKTTHSGILKYLIDEKTIYTSLTKGGLAAFNLEDGKLIWDVTNIDYVFTKPLKFNDYLILGSTSKNICIFNTKNKKFLDYFPVGSGISSEIVYKNSNLYFLSNNGILYSLLLSLK